MIPVTLSATPLVSVIVPVYNVEKYLSQCVGSITGQTLRDIEIILVDDGSPDGCPQLCDSLAASDPRIRVIHKENQGLGLARNSGLEIARGKWVMFVDSDDLIALNTLEYLTGIGESNEGVDQVRLLSSNISSAAPFSPSVADTDGEVIILAEGTERFIPILQSIAPLPDGMVSPAVSLASAWSAIYRRDVIVRNGLSFPSEREYISEDYIFNLDFAAVCGGIAYTTGRFYFYRVSPKSLTRTFKADRMEKSAFLCESMERRLSDMGIGYASHIAMGAMLVYMRAHHVHIFESSLTLAEKRGHFKDVNRNRLVKRIAKEYRFPASALKQRLFFALRRSYFAELAFTKLIDFVKSMAGSRR